MMLRHMGLVEFGDNIERAVLTTIAEGKVKMRACDSSIVLALMTNGFCMKRLDPYR